MGTIQGVYRTEEKYPISFVQSAALYSALRTALLPDKYNDPDGYMVRSVYFDNYSDQAYYDKLNGLENRAKVRLRVYSPDDAKVKLEIKKKIGTSQKKQSIIISRNEARAMINMDYAELLKNKDAEVILEKGIDLNSLRPVLMNQYKRSAFMHDINNIRITIDKELYSSETDFDLFADNPVMAPATDYYEALLEIKYDNFLFGWLKELLSSYGLNREAYSKYVFSRRLFENYMA